MSFTPTRSLSDTLCALSLSTNDNSLTIDLIRKIKTLLHDKDKTPIDRADKTQRLLLILERIFTSGATGEIFLHLIDRGATTAHLLQVNLEIPEPTVYRALKRLSDMQIITPEWKIPRPRYCGGGPRPQVWAILDAHVEDVAKAIRDHQKAMGEYVVVC